METLYTVTQKIRHCKTCPAKCEENKPIVGCESIMVPIPTLERCGKTYDRFCDRRVWFDKNHFPVKFYRWPTDKELNSDLTGEQWEKMLQDELEKIQAEATKHE